jgi:hypothetical protein
MLVGLRPRFKLSDTTYLRTGRAFEIPGQLPQCLTTQKMFQTDPLVLATSCSEIRKLKTLVSLSKPLFSAAILHQDPIFLQSYEGWPCHLLFLWTGIISTCQICILLAS